MNFVDLLSQGAEQSAIETALYQQPLLSGTNQNIERLRYSLSDDHLAKFMCLIILFIFVLFNLFINL